MIEINELTKYYGEAKAVGPLSFRVEKGEVIGLLGLNGAGKTTTLRMLSSELLPTSGEILIDGIDLVEEPEKVRARIGYLPDRPPLYGEMDVREYLMFAAELRKLTRSKAKRRVDEVIEHSRAPPPECRLLRGDLLQAVRAEGTQRHAEEAPTASEEDPARPVHG